MGRPGGSQFAVDLTGEGGQPVRHQLGVAEPRQVVEGGDRPDVVADPSALRRRFLQEGPTARNVAGRDRGPGPRLQEVDAGPSTRRELEGVELGQDVRRPLRPTGQRLRRRQRD
jgi:hypothetical protein